MRLSESQKDAVLQARSRPGDGHSKVELVRIGDTWACVWFVADTSPALRWRGQLVKEVRGNEAVAEFIGVLAWAVWWTGSEAIGRTRRAVIDALRVEASV